MSDNPFEKYSRPAGNPFEKYAPDAAKLNLRNITNRVEGAFLLGLGDEANAAIEAVLGSLDAPKTDFYTRYQDALKKYRTENKQFEEANPAAATAADVVGSMAIPMGAGRAAGGLAKAAALGATQAGAAGAITGFNTGEGGFENRAGNAAVSGGISAVMGAALPPAATALGAVVGRVLNITGFRNAEQAALRHIMRAFERDGVTPDDAFARLQQWQSQGAKPEALVDMGGENVRRLAETAVSVPGQSAQRASEFFTRRQAGQTGRVTDDAARTMDAANTPFYESLDKLVEARTRAAQPAYDEAYGVDAVWSDRIAELMRRPALQQAWTKARAIAANEGIELPRILRMKDGELVGTETIPDMRTMDFIKRGLDDVINANKNPLTGRIETDLGRSVVGLQREFLGELDRLNPAYATARAQYSGFTKSMEAVELGRTIFRDDAELTAREIANLSPGDKAFFRVGVLRALKDVGDNTPDGADFTRRLFGKPKLRERLEAAFENSQGYAQFAQLIERERRMYETMRQTTGGSPTARRLAAQDDMQNDPASGALSALMEGRGFVAAAMDVARRGLRRAQGMNPATADALSELLFDDRGLPNIANRLTERALADTAQAANTAAARGALMVGTGAAVGNVRGNGE